MAKKEIRLNKEIVAKKTRGYISGGLDDLIDEVKTRDDDSEKVRMNFEVSEELRNAFKAKVAMEGKKVKDVLSSLMSDYIKKKE